MSPRSSLPTMTRWRNSFVLLPSAPPNTGVVAAPLDGTDKFLSWREHLGAVLGDRHDVLQSNPEFPVLVDSRLGAGGHARLPHYLTPAHEVRPLVSFQSDAVTESVGEGSIVGPIAGVGDHFARGGVDIPASLSRCGGRQRASLRLVNDVENFSCFRRGRAEDDRARHVRLVAVNAGPAVDEDYLILRERARFR